MYRDPVHRTLAMILERLPVSIRQLSRASGISHVTLVRARDGDERLSQGAVERVAEALRSMAAELESAAHALEQASAERGD